MPKRMWSRVYKHIQKVVTLPWDRATVSTVVGHQTVQGQGLTAPTSLLLTVRHIHRQGLSVTREKPLFRGTVSRLMSDMCVP